MPALLKINTPTGLAAFVVNNILAVETFVGKVSGKLDTYGVRLHLVDEILQQNYQNIPCSSAEEQKKVFEAACTAIENEA